MKKTVLFFGLFALVACGEDVYHDIDKQNNGLEAANPASDNNSGGNVPFTIVPDYESFWDINTRGTKEMFYRFANWTGDWGHPGRLNFTVTPYVGLAYYDRFNDGIYEDSFSGTTVENFNTVPPGTYPNLYDPTGNEIGNFIPALPFMLDGSGLGGGTVVLEMVSGTHCHTLGASVNTLNPAGLYFDISGPPLAANIMEQNLLSQYGKVFFYFWEATDPLTNAVVWSGFIMPHCDTNNATFWSNTGVSVNVPGIGFPVDLYYNINSLGSPDPSHEIVLPFNIYPHEANFSYTVGGWTYNYKVELTTNSTGVASLLSLSYL